MRRYLNVMFLSAALLGSVNLQSCEYSCEDFCGDIGLGGVYDFFGKIFGWSGCEEVCEGEIQLVKPDGSNFGGNLLSCSQIITGSIVANTGSGPTQGTITLLTGSPGTFNSNGVSPTFQFPNGCITPENISQLTLNLSSFFGGSFFVSGDGCTPPECQTYIVAVNGSTTVNFDKDNCRLVIKITCFPAGCALCPC